MRLGHFAAELADCPSVERSGEPVPVRQPRRFFLTVHGVERDDAVSDLEFAEQLLCGGDFIGLFLDIDMSQDQAGLDVECVQQLGCLAVVEVVEASPECLPVQRDAAPRLVVCSIAQASGVTTEHLLDSLWIEALEDITNSSVSRRTLPAQTEGGVQPAAMHLDKGLDRAEGIATGDHGEDGEQQYVGQLVYLAFGSTWVRDLAEYREERIERLHGNLLVIWLPGIDSGI